MPRNYAAEPWYRFLNGMKILLNLDFHDLKDRGIMDAAALKDGQWEKFRADPFRWMMHVEDDRAEKLYALIEARQPKI